MTNEKQDELDEELNDIFDLPNPAEILPAVTKKDKQVEVLSKEPSNTQTDLEVKKESELILKQTGGGSSSEVQEKDFNYARTTIMQALEIGLNSLEQLSVIAESSQHPRAHEVVATLIKNISDSTKELLDLHKTMKELSKENAPAQKNITNNNLILTTDELLKKLKK